MYSNVYSVQELETLRGLANQKFGTIKNNWIDIGWWTAPHLTKWMLGKDFGTRNNQHITDTTHVSARRSYVSGFLEGNTSATRPWSRQLHGDPAKNKIPRVKKWLDHFNERCMKNLSSSNFYNEAARFYDHYGIFNTGVHYIVELPGRYFFYTLDPGSYRLINDQFGKAEILIMERRMNVKALVNEYGEKDKNGRVNWNNFSNRVKLSYERGNYTDTVDFVICVIPNKNFDPSKPVGGDNRQWVSLHYECGLGYGSDYVGAVVTGLYAGESADTNRKFLRIRYSKRCPFIAGKSPSSMNFEYGEVGPTVDAIGCIKSLNKKAVAKDKALEKILDPAVQGPANLKKSYRTTMSNAYIPLDPTSLAAGARLSTIHDINSAIVPLTSDVDDIRQQVNKLYYADFLLYLTMNPKTRTAEETRAIVAEQQMVIGPNLQSLNWTYNVPITDFNADWTLDNDPYLEPPPPELEGEFLRTEFISIFAQTQKAADLPSIDRYIQAMMNVGQMNPSALQKVNFDVYADLIEDRLYLPEGLNRDQAEVDSMRQQAQAMAARQQALQETLPALAGAAKDAASARQGQ